MGSAGSSSLGEIWEERRTGEVCEGIFMASVKGFGREAGVKRETRPGGLEDTEKA